jgi:hypothetical protein
MKAFYLPGELACAIREPMIYPQMLGDIREIRAISTPQNNSLFQRLLEDGSDIGPKYLKEVGSLVQLNRGDSE